MIAESQLPKVNFLQNQKAKLLLQSKRIYLIQSISITVLLIYFFFVSLVFSYYAYLNYKIGNINKQIVNKTEEIKALSDKEGMYLIMKNKTKSAIEIVNSMQAHQSLLQAVFKILPENISVENLKIDENNQITFSGLAYSYQDIEKFLKNIEANNEAQLVKINQASIENLKIDNNNLYSFSVKLLLSEIKG
ncbi:PilN domain-containing protein [Candidatus Beckwithbacteria bacterium]|nr:PilN domain-containing protein [Candidatus Beckwithbacteria bacterium]